MTTTLPPGVVDPPLPGAEAERPTVDGTGDGDGGGAWSSPTPPTARRLAGEQAVAAGFQLAAGAGNLAFVAVVARVLAPRAFAEVVAFLALYLLVHLPGGAFAAGAAADPGHRRASRVRWCGVLMAVVLWTDAASLGRLLHLRTPLVLLLGLAALAGPAVAGERGRRYAAGDIRGVGASLLAEPAGRLVMGVPLAVVAGATGAALGVVAGGLVAAVYLFRRPGRVGFEAPAARSGSGGWWTVTGSFALLAVIQNQDLVLANRVLADGEAARFAVLSTIGGLVAFATATVPLVLLPRARRGDAGALRIAVTTAAALGGAAVVSAAVVPDGAFAAVFGSRYGSVSSIAPLYLTAMAALGVARVLTAERCARHRSLRTFALVLAAAGVQAALVLSAGSAAGVARATLVASVLLAAGVALAPRLPAPADVAARAGGVARALRRPEVLAVTSLTGVALVLRLWVDRGLWVDEAISVDLAGRSFGAMLRQIGRADVHPPLHAVLLWLTARVAGTSELSMRLPSMLAGAGLVPVLWLAGRSLYDRRTALVAAALGAVSPLLVWYSQEARMYSLFMLLAVVALWAQVKAVREGGTGAWAWYAVASAALLWTQYFSVLVVAVQQVGFAAAVLRARREDRANAARIARGWVLSMLAIAVAVAPLFPIFSDQVASYGSRRAASPPSAAGAAAAGGVDQLSVYSVLANAVWAVAGFHADRTMAQIVALWPLGLLVCLLVLGRRRSAATTLVVAMATFPPAVLFFVGLHKRDLFELRYFVATAPLAVLLAARFLTTIARARWAVPIASGLAVAVLLAGLADQQLNGANPRRYDFRGALASVEARAHPGDTVLFAPSYLAAVVDYYGHGLPARPLVGTAPPSGGGVFVVATFRTINEKATSATVGSRLADLEHGRRVVARFDRPNVRVWELR